MPTQGEPEQIDESNRTDDGAPVPLDWIRRYWVTAAHDPTAGHEGMRSAVAYVLNVAAPLRAVTIAPRVLLPVEIVVCLVVPLPSTLIANTLLLAVKLNVAVGMPPCLPTIHAAVSLLSPSSKSSKYRL